MEKYDELMKNLKEMLGNEEDFNKTFDYFFDCIGDQKGFNDLGKVTKVPILKKVFKKIGQEIFGDQGQVTKLLPIYVKKYKFYHGPCFIDGRMAGFFFFQELDMGMISIAHHIESDRVSFVRFTSYKIEGGGGTAVLVPGTNTIQ